MRSLQKRIKKITEITTNIEKQERAKRSRRAQALAARATREEIAAIIDKVVKANGDKDKFLKQLADHELLIINSHWNEYVEAAVAAMPKHKQKDLVRRYAAAKDGNAFLESLTDTELAALNYMVTPEEDRLDWDAIPEDVLKAIIDGDISSSELHERYPYPKE